MRLVVDSNAFISALLKDGVSRELVLNFQLELFIPEVAFEEINEHKKELIKRSELSEAEFDLIVSRLSKHMTIVPSKKALPFKQEADNIMGHIDEDDVPFIATALALGDIAIWSDDAYFLKQNKIRVYSTKELVNELSDKEAKQL